MEVPGFARWEESVSAELKTDPLWRMKVYRLSLFLGTIAWRDVTKLSDDKRTVATADQLYRAIGSIGANIAEGYSRGSGKDRAKYYEYALGSARESRHWYAQSEAVLEKHVVEHRFDLLSQIIKLLLTVTPVERTRYLKEAGIDYEVSDSLDGSIPWTD
ncbi:MAG: four helix bundle protein [Chloroflexia bacterium]